MRNHNHSNRTRSINMAGIEARAAEPFPSVVILENKMRRWRMIAEACDAMDAEMMMSPRRMIRLLDQVESQIAASAEEFPMKVADE
jgi:hypothetical protein